MTSPVNDIEKSSVNISMTAPVNDIETNKQNGEGVCNVIPPFAFLIEAAAGGAPPPPPANACASLSDR